MDGWDFAVRRDDLREARFFDAPGEAAATADGDVLLRVDRFALTANNVTYGALGDTNAYWCVFPAEEGWGRIPVWGFGTVVRSRHPEVAEGERYFGYFPMSTHVTMRPGRVGRTGFQDAAASRAALHPLYNGYARTTNDALYDPAHENDIVVLRPLFITSFVLDWSVADRFGDTRTIVSSASSKTAFGFAFLRARRHAPSLGLTSAANVPFVRGLAWYDGVCAYGSLAGNALGGDALAGNALGGSALGGDALGGDALGDDALTSDVVGGDVLGGDALGGDSLTGDALGGDSLAGDALGGGPLAGEALAEQARQDAALTEAAHGDCVYVDFSGNRALREAVHARFGSRLRASIAVGFTHWEALDATAPTLPGSTPELFFALDAIREHVTAGGTAAFNTAFAAAWRAFLEALRARPGLLAVSEAQGRDALRAAYEATLAGRLPPNEGRVIVPS